MHIWNKILLSVLLLCLIVHSMIFAQNPSDSEYRVIVWFPPVAGSAAETAGILQNDTILEINGKKILHYSDVGQIINDNKDAPLNITILRDGDILTKVLIPSYSEEYKRYMIGITPFFVMEYILDLLRIDEELVTYRYYSGLSGKMEQYWQKNDIQ